MISADLLRRLRNDLPMPVTIAALGREGPPSKMSEGYFRFLCPHCGEMRATVNPRNNLAHCFCCKKNLNNIDLLLTLDYDFRAAVALLERWLNAIPGPAGQEANSDRAQQSHVRSARYFASTIPSASATRTRDASQPVAPSFSKILNNSANSPSPRQNPYSLNLATNAIRIWPGTVTKPPSTCTTRRSSSATTDTVRAPLPSSSTTRASAMGAARLLDAVANGLLRRKEQP